MRKFIFIIILVFSLFIRNSSLLIAQTGWSSIYYQNNLLSKSYFVNENTGFVVGAIGSGNNWLILKTTNGGNNWIQQNGPFSTPELQSVFFVNDLTGYIVGGYWGFNPIFFKTTNQGVNWININLGYNNYAFWDIAFMNLNIGIITGSGLILRTTNGGNNWLQINCNVNVDLWKIAFAKSNSGLCYAVGSNSCILRSLDSGQTWSIQRLSTDDTIFTSISIVNDSICYISGEMGSTPYYPVLCKTTNSGNNWINMPNTLPSYCKFWSSVHFFSDMVGIIAAGGVFKTTNGGINWKMQEYSVLGSNYNDLFFLNQNFGIAISGSTSGAVYKTTNGGDGPPNAPSYLSCTRKYGVNRLFWLDNSLIELGFKIQRTNLSDTLWTEISSVGTNITSYNDSNTTENVKYRICAFNEFGNSPFSNIAIPIVLNINEQPKKEYYLLENYPNPFNTITKIKFKFSLDKGGLKGVVSLKVYDLLGKEIQTLENEKLQPGTYEVTFDGSNLPSGVYIYKLSTDNYTETKKMMLIK